MGLVGYYRRLFKEFASLGKPLSLFTSKREKFLWGEAQESAFLTYHITLMGDTLVLASPEASKENLIDSEDSGYGPGAVLLQCLKGQEQVVTYFNETIIPCQHNYCVVRRELLVVWLVVAQFKPFLYGQQFKLRTGHASLRWLLQKVEASDQVARWLETLD